MLVRAWNRDTDYDTLVKWWKDWEFGVVPKECLPPVGVMVEEEGKPICAGGLYVGEGTQFKSLKLCIDKIMSIAKDKGLKLVYTATKHEALGKRYEKYHQMMLTESNVKTFLRDLDGNYTKDLEWIQDEEQYFKHNK